MALYYTHRYKTLTEYDVIAHYDDGFERVVSPIHEQWWIYAGNIPVNESGDRFIMIVDGVPVEDPNKDAILAAEAAAIAAEEARIAAKAQAIIDNLPSWQQVSDAIDAATTIAAIKVIIKKMARIVYWLAKDRAD